MRKAITLLRPASRAACIIATSVVSPKIFPPGSISASLQKIPARRSKFLVSSPPSTIISTTRICPSVKVPVLSTQRAVTEPNVSAATNFLIRAFRSSNLRMPIVRITETATTNSAGMAAIAKAIAVVNISTKGIRAKNPATKTVNAKAIMPTVTKFANFLSLFCKGVSPSSTSTKLCAIPPTCVEMPVATTTVKPVPLFTIVPAKAIFNLSGTGVPSGKNSTIFFAGDVSPVSTASEISSISASIIRTSARTRSPALKTIISPGTTLSAAIITKDPSRITGASYLTIAFNASSVLSDFHS